MQLSEEMCNVLTSEHLAHLFTLEPDGTPQVTLVWVGLEITRSWQATSGVAQGGQHEAGSTGSSFDGDRWTCSQRLG